MSIHFCIYWGLPAVTFEIDQQISFRTAFLGWSSILWNSSRTPASIASWANSSLPVKMFPSVRRHGTDMVILGCESIWMSRGTALHRINSAIRSSPPSSEAYEKAHAMSDNISSLLFSIMTLVKDGIHGWMRENFAIGRPLQKFDSVQVAFLVNELPAVALSTHSAIFKHAPYSRTTSLRRVESPEIFPRHQITYSLTSIWLDWSSIWIRIGMALLSTRFITNRLSPLATFVKHQTASNWSFGES